MSMLMLDVVCEQGHEAEALLERDDEGFPVFEPCAMRVEDIEGEEATCCGAPTKRLWRPASAQGLQPWEGIEGTDPKTGAAIPLRCEADRRALEERWNKMSGGKAGELVALGPAEKNRLYEEARHRRREERIAQGMGDDGR